MSRRRAVYIDGHIVGQHFDGREWWTGVLAFNQNLSVAQYAVWNQLNEKEALSFWKPDVIVHTELTPIQKGQSWSYEAEEWVTDPHDVVPKPYFMVLRYLARMVE